MKDGNASPLALAILALLYEASMHPYRMQQLIRDRGKDQVVNVRQRASLYQVIDRLRRDGLIRVQETIREVNRPERTVYEITADGRATAEAWARQMLSSPSREFPLFPAVLAHLALLAPEDVLQQLEQREKTLAADLVRMADEHRRHRDTVPRLFLIELEYQQLMTRTEARWVHGLAEDLRTGSLAWNEKWKTAVAKGLGPGAPADPPAAPSTARKKTSSRSRRNA